LPSVSITETDCPPPGISIGAPITLPLRAITFLMDSFMLSTAMTTDGWGSGESGFFAKNPPLIAPGFGGGGENIIANAGAEHLRLPAQCGLIKFRHRYPVLVGHPKVNHGIHHFPPLQFH
jgi:hypothetical protein